MESYSSDYKNTPYWKERTKMWDEIHKRMRDPNTKWITMDEFWRRRREEMLKKFKEEELHKKEQLDQTAQQDNPNPTG